MRHLQYLSFFPFWGSILSIWNIWLRSKLHTEDKCKSSASVHTVNTLPLSIHCFINFLLMLQSAYGPGRTATLRQSSYVSVAMENTICAVQYFHTYNTIYKADTHLNSGWSTAETACEHSEFCKSAEAENTPKIFRSWLF